MSKACCMSGFNWDGQPQGREGKLAGNNAYIVGSKKDVAILMIHDVYGWTFTNLRLIADHLAKEVGATVYVADFFGGEVVTPDTLSDLEKRENFDLGAFMGRNSKDIRFSEIKACAEALRQDFSRTGAIGYCYGGWGCFQLGSREKLVDCIAMAHPSGCTKEEIAGVHVPVQIMAPEHDHQFTPELKEFANKAIPTLGVDYDYQYFPGLGHGFALKGDVQDPKQKAGLERAKNAAVLWFTQHLHLHGQ